MVLLLCCFATVSLLGRTFESGGPRSNNNDDTCDIGLFPAATLLLPHFDVDMNNATGQGETTVFSVTNVSTYEQIALVTLWTDAAFPLLSFNIYLTGYDTQSINLYDVIVLGQMAPPRGTGVDESNRGDFSRENAARNTSTCRSLPHQIPAIYQTRMREAFTRGRVPAFGDEPACETVGRAHPNGHAIGYVTIDVVSTCTPLTPSDPRYFSEAIAFDNVLTGEYMQVNRATHSSEGNPMVHIRAIPEGESAATRATLAQYVSNFPSTFYGRLTGTSKRDGRQPLPSRFATRWMQGGPGEFQTELTLWREPLTVTTPSCAAYGHNRAQRTTEYVVFDEDENAQAAAYIAAPDADFPVPQNVVTSTMRLGFRDSELPEPEPDAVAGWVYVNLDDPTGQPTGYAPRQGWITTSLRAEGRYSVGVDAIAMGNGCSPNERSEIGFGNVPLGPSANVNP